MVCSELCVDVLEWQTVSTGKSQPSNLRKAIVEAPPWGSHASCSARAWISCESSVLLSECSGSIKLHQGVSHSGTAMSFLLGFACGVACGAVLGAMVVMAFKPARTDVGAHTTSAAPAATPAPMLVSSTPPCQAFGQHAAAAGPTSSGGVGNINVEVTINGPAGGECGDQGTSGANDPATTSRLSDPGATASSDGGEHGVRRRHEVIPQKVFIGSGCRSLSDIKKFHVDKHCSVLRGDPRSVELCTFCSRASARDRDA